MQCQKCHSKENLETHHIQDKQFSDDHNMIKHFHQNKKHNLVCLCKRCHLQVTNKEIIITGWIQTSNGIQLQWNHNSSSNKSKTLCFS